MPDTLQNILMIIKQGTGEIERIILHAVENKKVE